MPIFRKFFLFLAFFSIWPASAPCLTANEIAVIANLQEEASVGLARYYLEKRSIPAANLIVIDVEPSESCSREDYDRLIALPVQRFLQKNPGKIKCLVTMFGVPLKITSPKFTGTAELTLHNLREKKKAMSQSLKDAEHESLLKSMRSELARLKEEINALSKMHDMRAAVDSELSLVLRVHPLADWLANPYFSGKSSPFLSIGREDVLLVSRLDGPTPSIVRRIINDSLTAEKRGLTGSAFFDARWPDPGLREVRGYAYYDRSIHRAASLVRRGSRLAEVVIDDDPALFQPGPERPAALYCGWYSLGRYVDAFSWQTGAVGYHIASSECTTLKRENSQVWCKMMLEKGVAATLGPVGEPFVQAFPLPELFFAYLTSGKNLVESYFFSLPFVSWKMALIGDPLYTPFPAHPGKGLSH